MKGNIFIKRPVMADFVGGIYLTHIVAGRTVS